MTLNLSVPGQNDLRPRISVFGIGGAGGNAVNNMIEKQLEGAEFVAANTDAQALQQSNAKNKIQMGVKVTEGLGAGARASIGAAAAEETIIQQEKISYEKCLKVITTSEDKLSIAPEIKDVSDQKRIAVFTLVDGTLTITCDGLQGEVLVSTNTN